MVFFFLVQSASHDPKAIEGYYVKWIDTIHKRLQKITSFEFDNIKNGVIVDLLQPDKTISERHSRLVFEAIDLHGNFGYKNKVAEAAKSVNKEDVLSALKGLFDQTKRAAVTVYLQKKEPSKDLTEYLKKTHKVIVDKAKYRKEQGVYQ